MRPNGFDLTTNIHGRIRQTRSAVNHAHVHVHDLPIREFDSGPKGLGCVAFAAVMNLDSQVLGMPVSHAHLIVTALRQLAINFHVGSVEAKNERAKWTNSPMAVVLMVTISVNVKSQFCTAKWTDELV